MFSKIKIKIKFLHASIFSIYFFKRCGNFLEIFFSSFHVINNINIFMLKNKIIFISNYLNKLLTSYYKLKKQKPWQKKQEKPLRKKPLKKGTEKQLRKSLLKGSTKKKEPRSAGFFFERFFLSS